MPGRCCWRGRPDLLPGPSTPSLVPCLRPPPPMPLPSGVSPPRSWSLCVTLCAPQCPSLSGRSFGISVSTCPSLQGPVGQGEASHRTGLSSQWHGFGVGEQATSWLPCLARGWQAQGLVLGVPGLLYYALRGGRVSSGACPHVLVESGTCILQPEGPRRARVLPQLLTPIFRCLAQQLPELEGPHRFPLPG